MQEGILPLPAPLGVFAQRICQHPTRLRIRSNGTQAHAMILDDWGREVIAWQKVGGWADKHDFFVPGSLERLYTLRLHKHGILKRFSNGRSKPWMIVDNDGGEICSLEPIDSRNCSKLERNFDIDFVNTVNRGEPVRLYMRQSLHCQNSAIMLGAQPVVLINRPTWFLRDLLWSGNSLNDEYQALVAPGVDLLWIATILSTLDLLYQEN